jgi:hypothetical protein
MTLNIRRIAFAVVKTGLVFGILAGGFWAFTHRQEVVDWWQLLSYKPASDIVALADATTMTHRGRDMFYVSNPKVEDSQAFNLDCSDVGEEGSVLGCYTPIRRIFIFNVTDNRLPRVKEVTAAHEMLHAAYDRLDSAAKKKVDILVQAEADRLASDASLQELIKLYVKSEPGELQNELHSIIGTEYGGLSAELENYYKQYFTDRAKVVSYAKAYKAIFAQSKARIAAYDAQLATWKKQIAAMEAELTARRAELDSQNKYMSQLRHSNPDAYNQQVPIYNARVREFNQLAKQYNELVNKYNQLVVTRNKEAAAQNDLSHSLDSKYQSVSSN